MQEEFLDQIKTQLKTGMTEFLAQTDLKEHDLFVLGCSTSEIQGKTIGKYSNLDIGRTIVQTLTEILPQGVDLAVQGCEHLNRALAMERQVALDHGLRYRLCLSKSSCWWSDLKWSPLRPSLILSKSSM